MQRVVALLKMSAATTLVEPPDFVLSYSIGRV